MPSSTPSCSAIASASSVCERPEKTIRRFWGPRSIQCPGWGWLTDMCSAARSSRPGSTSSVGALASCISLLVLLACAGDREGTRGHVLRDRRSGGDPCSLSHLHGRDEAILDAGPDVPPDPRPALLPPRLVREVCGDRAGADVRVGADVGVADVREVGHLRAWSDG